MLQGIYKTEEQVNSKSVLIGEFQVNFFYLFCDAFDFKISVQETYLKNYGMILGPELRGHKLRIFQSWNICDVNKMT